jgi:tetratricopeptide (TPR) repeat protein
MRKNILYIVFFALLILTIGIFLYKHQKQQISDENKIYTLIDRKGAAAKTEEWKNLKLRGQKLLRDIQSDPDDPTPKLTLAGLFIQEARVTGNYAYYDKAAMNYVNDVLKHDSLNFEALTLKSLLYLSQHHFEEGLYTAEKAKQINPYNAFVYGILVDGNVEMGHYEEAVKNAESMINIRPDIRSYSRVSYLREIHGDYPGAIEAMEMAVEAGPPGDEATEWARVHLGILYENTGDLKKAAEQYNISVSVRPGYAYALAGLARIATANKNYKQAVAYYQMADSSVNDLSIKEALAEVYKLSGDNKQADELEKAVIKGMSEEAESGKKDENIGHYVDRELAYAHLKQKNFDKALEHALMEYNRRPENIDVNEAVAWVYYCKGDFDNALPYIKTALKTKSKNPTLLCRAGLIFAKTGDISVAKVSLKEALKANANIADNLKAESITTLQSL